MPLSYTDSDGDRYYIAYNQIGSPRAVTDETGNVLKTITYDSFGNILLDSNPDLRIPFGFAGGLYDEDTGLTRFGFRDYDASTGKWTAKDPIGFAGGDTNLYGYVLGDPVGFVDAMGLDRTLGESLSVLGDRIMDGTIVRDVIQGVAGGARGYEQVMSRDASNDPMLAYMQFKLKANEDENKLADLADILDLQDFAEDVCK